MKNVYLLILLFLASTSYSQGNLKFDYIGTLIIADTFLLSYELQFNIKDDSIIGYSYTDIGGEDETKSKITGVYTEETGSFLFQESEILYTKSPFIDGDFCFVNGVGKLSFKKNDSRISGDFIGNLPEGDRCANGKFDLVSLKTIKRKIEKLNKKVNRSILIKKKTKEEYNKVNLMAGMETSILRADDKLSLFCNSEIIKIELWDNQIEDGDIISVIFNNEELLTSYKVQNKKKILMLKLKKGGNSLSFIADGIGLSGNNTTSINIAEKTKSTLVSTSLYLNQQTNIILINQ